MKNLSCVLLATIGIHTSIMLVSILCIGLIINLNRKSIQEMIKK
ncbi:hypothetical protein HWC99_gp21 [Flavobacterium phage vB_FspS_tant8-1]|uniref:Uncharacterized protein n=1 Tax=Flavobacterium phage vB_FspS_tant8-1 TaxID=2686278 RepID=A0A6B9LG46_9CAUD|nr:hypothetical protein HWC99_gp21 [Flavobacterium phage vB_FspS_tant8-1]QHB40952.1 hypothetical protein tant81_gp021 [Flavobacterium phage vB_FspS_tant8-1]